jgi:trk system potassium uptake protein
LKLRLIFNLKEFTLRIIVIGTGEVGIDLSLMLSHEKQDVIVIDQDRTALEKCAEHNDVMAIEGSGTSPSILQQAGAADADLVIAATNSDEVNMVACMMCKRLGARKTIARIRDEELTAPDSPIQPRDLGIDAVINPERSLAHEILLLVKRAAASDVVDLAQGKMQVIGLRVPETSSLVGLTLKVYAERMSAIPFRVVAIFRNGTTIIPQGHEKLRKNDHVFILTLTQHVKTIIRSTGISDHPIRNIMIAGGSRVGRYTAQLMSQAGTGWRIKLIEPDYDVSYKAAVNLKSVLVLNGDPTDPGLLASEGITDTDVFIAVTEDEESNIISCLMAKHLKVPKVIAMVSKPDYIPLSQTIGLDSSVNKKTAAANEIHRHVLGQNLLQVAALSGIDAEVIELKISEGSRATKKTLSETTLPDGCIIGGIICNGEVSIATGNSQLQPGNSVLVVCRHDVINNVTSWFS